MLTLQMIGYVQQLMLYGRPPPSVLMRLLRIEAYLLKRFSEME